MDFTSSTIAPHGYAVASDLSKLCLPQEYKDSNRRLAWVNSICCLFLMIGFVGLNPPRVHVKPLSDVTEIVPVVIIPPDDVPPPKPTEQPPEPEPTAETTTDTPVVATVVAADASKAAFAVPVEGPVVLVPTRFAGPPPQNLKTPPSTKPVALQSAEEDWGGSSNQPDYPGLAQRNGYQGTVSLEITFDPSGAVLSAKVLKSSGFSILDNAALDKVKKHLRLRVPPGSIRVCTKDCVFRLQ
jgi:TonB family protein